MHVYKDQSKHGKYKSYSKHVKILCRLKLVNFPVHDNPQTFEHFKQNVFVVLMQDILTQPKLNIVFIDDSKAQPFVSMIIMYFRKCTKMLWLRYDENYQKNITNIKYRKILGVNQVLHSFYLLLQLYLSLFISISIFKLLYFKCVMKYYYQIMVRRHIFKNV